MKNYLFEVLEEDLSKVEEELKIKGLKEIFTIEDQGLGKILIGGQSPHEIRSEKALLKEENHQVDWEEQWALFAQNFREGKANIQIKDQILQLLPGAGFGDLSHPSTSLMLEMMENQVQEEFVVDIGCGSGILTLASLLLGAQFAMGIDIDAASLKHAKENAKLYQQDQKKANFKVKFLKKIPKTYHQRTIFLMNMIFPEQKEVNPMQYHPIAKRWIVSGILKSEREKYLMQSAQWKWKMISEFEKLGWLGFIFEISAS